MAGIHHITIKRHASGIFQHTSYTKCIERWALFNWTIRWMFTYTLIWIKSYCCFLYKNSTLDFVRCACARKDSHLPWSALNNLGKNLHEKHTPFIWFVRTCIPANPQTKSADIKKWKMLFLFRSKPPAMRGNSAHIYIYMFGDVRCAKRQLDGSHAWHARSSQANDWEFSSPDWNSSRKFSPRLKVPTFSHGLNFLDEFQPQTREIQNFRWAPSRDATETLKFQPEYDWNI